MMNYFRCLSRLRWLLLPACIAMAAWAFGKTCPYNLLGLASAVVRIFGAYWCMLWCGRLVYRFCRSCTRPAGLVLKGTALLFSGAFLVSLADWYRQGIPPLHAPVLLAAALGLSRTIWKKESKV